MQVLPPGRTGGPSRLFIMRPVATTLLMVAILLAGIIGYRFLPVSALPEVDYPTIQVVTLYPGASPDVVTSAITAPLERQFGQMSGLKQMSSQSSGGASVVTLQFQLTLPLDVAEQEVQAAINAATNLLPSDLPNPPVYSKVNPADPPIMTLAVTSSAIPMTQVEDMVETRVAQKISQVSGVGLVTLAGGQRPAVRVKLNAQAIAALGLTSETVRTAITSANVNSAKGSLDGPARAVTLSANDQMQSAEDYRRLIIAYQNGAPIRLGDVASVEQGAENSWLGAWANQQRAIVMNVQRQPGANIIDTADSIRQMLPQLTESLPKSVKVQVLSDRTTNIRASVRDTQFELMLAIALVVTGFSAWFVADNALLRGLFMGSRTGTLVLIVATFALVWRLSSAMGKMSLKTAAAMFLVYSVLNGITLSAVFLTYTLSSIGGVFFMTAGTFGIMSVYGYVTKADLSKMGNMCLMGLFGIILATVLGFFFDSTLLQMLISYAGILIFTGLTIYDTQSIKRLALTYHSRATDEGQKVAIMGALTLYLDFINIFIYLLRLFGDRK